MWMEAKALITTFSFIFLGVVISQLIFLNLFMTFMLIISMFLFLFGDILLGYLITKNDLKPQIDPTPYGKEPCVFVDNTSKLHIFNTTKGPEGQRKFVFNKHEATIINKGNYQVRLKNGNSAFIGHESCDENLNFAEAKYAEAISKEFESDDLKDIHAKILTDAEVKQDG